MALNDNALTTLQTVKDELGITTTNEDSYLERQINVYSSLFEDATDRKWFKGDEVTEKIKSHGDTRLVVSEHTPIESIKKIVINGNEIESSTYEIEDASKGYIQRTNGVWPSTAVGRRRMETYNKYSEFDCEVTYTGGYVTPHQADTGQFTPRDLPYDIEEAVLSTISTKYKLKDRPGNIESESIEGASVSYGSLDSRVLGQNVTSLFASTVSRYKDRSF
jgi:hypothetical protein